jgi:hypothetical protein
MRRLPSPFLSRRTILVVIAACGIALAISHGLRLSQTRSELAAIGRRRADLDAAVAAAEAETRRWRDQADRDQATSSRTLAQGRGLEKELAAIDPESRWATPPLAEREWDPKSPYVWLRKDLLPSFPVNPFDDQGHLRTEIAAVLNVDPAQVRALDAAVGRLVAENKRCEVARARPTDDHLPNIREYGGPKVTLRIDPDSDEGARMRQEFLATLEGALGPQRAALLEQTAESWVDSKIASTIGVSKTFSAVRNPDGSFAISIQSGTMYMHDGGVRALGHHIPPHLLPFFSALEGNDGDSGPPTP